VEKQINRFYVKRLLFATPRASPKARRREAHGGIALRVKRGGVAVY